MGRMRIVAGQYRGTVLASPRDRSVRPTSERAREALFNILDHRDQIVETRFLDLFCGSGAVGLEAFSRGAAKVWLVDQDTSLAERNAAAIGRPASVQVLRREAARLGPPPCLFDVVFMDPPYRSGLAGPAIGALSTGWLADNALVIVELAANEDMEPPRGFTLGQERRYGSAKLIFFEPAADAASVQP